MRMHVLGFFVVMAVVIVLSACTTRQAVGITPPQKDAGVGVSPAKDVSINMFSWGFNQSVPVIKKGDTVRLHMKSLSGIHGIMIPGLGVSTGRVMPGQEKVVEFVAKDVGTFDYFCNVPCGKGHRTMRGTLVVEP